MNRWWAADETLWLAAELIAFRVASLAIATLREALFLVFFSADLRLADMGELILLPLLRLSTLVSMSNSRFLWVTPFIELLG